jgi:hypothetical protein
MSMLRLFSRLVAEPLKSRARQFGFVREDFPCNPQPERSAPPTGNADLGLVEKGSLGGEDILIQDLQTGEGI